ncbi:3'(2'),5'-bisphosphate nucleotidase CysQ [Sphingomonas sp.]|uniref:3'(2'),5'-bisphosphate nucleotidase CysQ n=1 Tax=Sphingomonas sp. TaxID=28214 RepID=UPI003CC53F7D
MDAGITDAALARAVATATGALLLDIRATSGLAGPALGARGDRAADDLILPWLRAARPDDFILSEETLDDGRRCSARRVWVVDPLDGTNDYAGGRDDWAVHVGLAIDGAPIAGAVALPMRGAAHATDDPPPAFAPLPNRLRMVASRTRCPAVVERVAAALDAELFGMGSAGAKAMAVVDGRADIYLHAGGQFEWDSCAPVAVALAAGLHASRIDGAPLRYNCTDPLLPDLLICRREVAAAVLALVAADQAASALTAAASPK